MFANHGALKKHHHEFEGINSRLDGLQAAILSVKLNHIHDWTDLRIQHAAAYSALLSNMPGIITPVTHVNGKHVFHLYVIRSDKRDELQIHLKEQDISTGIHYPTALPFLKAYNYLGHSNEDFPVSYKFQKEILSLPMYPELSIKQIKFVSETIGKFYSN